MLIDCFLKVNVELFYRKMDAMKKKKSFTVPLNRSSHCYFGDSHICTVFKNYFISSEQS